MIECNRLDRSFELSQKEFEKKAIEVLRSGQYILGRELNEFEKEFAQYLTARYCAGVGSGLDALQIALQILEIGQGDEVIMPGNTFIATALAVTKNGAVPVFVDPDEFYHIDPDKIESKVTERTKCILVVHLYGQPACMDKIMKIAQRYSLDVLEDCAQSHGALYRGKMTGTFGDMGCYSFYPTKNLGAFGDGGAIVSDKKEYIEKAKVIRNYGSDKKYHYKTIGMNSRLDELQAGLLRVRLKHIAERTEERRYIAERYYKGIQNTNISLPKIREGADVVWHQYVIRVSDREYFMKYMEEQGITTLIHYPVPVHMTEAYRFLNIKRGSLPITEKYANEVVSLPMYNGMTEEEIGTVIAAINKYKGRKKNERY